MRKTRRHGGLSHIYEISVSIIAPSDLHANFCTHIKCPLTFTDSAS